MTRRIFGTRAALFVLGCALQVCGAIPALKRALVTSHEHIEIGMEFHPNIKDPTETWIVADEGNYIIRNGVREGVDNSRENKWNVCRVLDGVIDPRQDPLLICFDHGRDLGPWHFHFPGI